MMSKIGSVEHQQSTVVNSSWDLLLSNDESRIFVVLCNFFLAPIYIFIAGDISSHNLDMGVT